MPNHHDLYQVSLKVIVSNEHDEILVLNARPTGSFAGYFDLPGGRIDVDQFEVPYLTILREKISSELGPLELEFSEAPVAIGRHLISQDSDSGEGRQTHLLYVFFAAKYVGGNLVLSSQHSGFRWLNLHKHKLPDLFKSGLLEGVSMYLKSQQV